MPAPGSYGSYPGYLEENNRQSRQTFGRNYPNEHRFGHQKKIFINGGFNLEDFKPSHQVKSKVIDNSQVEWIPKSVQKKSEDEYDCILRCRKIGIV